jgi:hypothetical protein
MRDGFGKTEAYREKEDRSVLRKREESTNLASQS